MQMVKIDSPTGPLTVTRVLAEQLLKATVISGDIDGRLHVADAATVKAAMMAGGLLCDFCGNAGVERVYKVPDFVVPEAGINSTHGWGVCTECDVFVRKNDRKSLLERSLGIHAFAKFGRTAVQALHEGFWNAMDGLAETAGTMSAIGDYIEGRISKPLQANVPRDHRVAQIMKLTGLSPRQVEDLVNGDADTTVITKIHRLFKGWKTGVSLAEFFETGIRKPMTPVLPHWQVALDMKFEALRVTLEGDRQRKSFYTPQSTDLTDQAAVRRVVQEAQRAKDQEDYFLKEDAEALRHAESYSFNEETAAAIIEASQSIPLETPLAAFDTPGNGRAGWFWFSTPLPIQTISDSPDTHALLWYWLTGEDGKPELRLSVYNQMRGGALLPATYWRWGRDQDVDGLQAYVSAAYLAGAVRVDDNSLSQEQSMAAIIALSKFFAAACLWMKEKIAVAAPGHVERHARKRLQKEHKLAEPPTVQVIALRKSERQRAEGPREPGDGTPRDYRFRFVVRGHPRLQAVGPGRADRKLIWISSFIKGPDDKPLRTKERVYAVIR